VKPFGNKVCCKCCKDAEMLHLTDVQEYYCWSCFGRPVKKRANDMEERKHMGASVRFAWRMVEVANQRLEAAGLQRVNSPGEKP
jgi:hypothetical protein